jgi:hypothetical protein
MTNGCRGSLAVACLAMAALHTGCDAKSGGLAPVSGIITLDGKPVPGAQVSFQPQGGEQKNPGPGSAGVCDVSGRYELTTIRKEPGAVTGPHAVRVYGPKDKMISGSDVDVPGRKELFPPKYNFQTELSFEVPAGGTDQANFDLSSN